MQMIRKPQPLEYVAAVVEKDCRDYSLGEVVREIVDLTLLRVAQGLDTSKESKRTIDTIESRLDKLYTELDHREGLYKYRPDRRY